jgi:hypothetical protein
VETLEQEWRIDPWPIQIMDIHTESKVLHGNFFCHLLTPPKTPVRKLGKTCCGFRPPAFYRASRKNEVAKEQSTRMVNCGKHLMQFGDIPDKTPHGNPTDQLVYSRHDLRRLRRPH